MGLFGFFKKNQKKKESEKEDFTNIESEDYMEEQTITESLNPSNEAINQEEILEEEVPEEIQPDIHITQIKNEEILQEPDETIAVVTPDLPLFSDQDSSMDEQPPDSETAREKKGFFAKMLSGLDKTRKNIMGNVEAVLKSFVKIDEEFYEELEEALIAADIGVTTSIELIERLRQRVKEDKIVDGEQVKAALIDEISHLLSENNNELELPSPSVILVIGVNGVGKTTTIGKMAANYKKQGKKVMLAAADTFRAAAIDQLQVWGHRSDVPVIAQQENSDPGAVIFDAIHAAKSRKTDLLICDTAGRLHNKKNLMEELKKIYKIINREYPEAKLETFIVLDATTGQNALQQAKTFKEICDITGIVLTKLDGTAKGGIILSIVNELKIPVRFICVGEGIEDMQPFESDEFAKALFSEESFT